MTEAQRLKFDSWAYQRKLEANRGHNYPYATEKFEAELERKGYEWYEFEDSLDYTRSEDDAKKVQEDYRSKGYYAKIVCGRMQVVQRIKYYSVAFKKKKK